MTSNIIEIAKENNGIWVVNPINTVGVMGAGLAKQFKDNFPSHYLKYRQAYYWRQLKPGKMLIDKENKIIGFPTKRHWKYPSKPEYIRKGLEALLTVIQLNPNIRVIVLPRLGCGHGGLDFETQVYPLIINILSPVASRVLVSSKGKLHEIN